MSYIRKVVEHPPAKLPGELWKDIPGTNGKYQASNLGRLRTNNWKGTGETHVMKPAHDANGYLRTMIRRYGRVRTVKVHRVIAETWIGIPEKGRDQINHINNIRDDNRVENLEWVSKKENLAWMMLQGRQTMNHGSKNGMSKRTGLTEEKVREIRRRYDVSVMTRRQWADEFGIGLSALSDIVYGRSWKHVK